MAGAMRNIFLFIRRYFNFLLFLLLQGLSIYFIVEYSKYHQVSFSNMANQFTGKINTRYNQVENYFYLKRANDSLVKANEALYNKLKINFELPDSVNKIVIDSMKIDSLLQYRKYNYIESKVVANSVNTPNNFIVISGGRKRNLKEGMGVVDINNKTVGIITDVSDDYAIVMSLLHKDSHISGKLFKSGETGTLNWEGKEPNFLTLSGISKTAKVAKGDSIITSGFSTTFPKGLLIGIVEAVYPETSANYFKIKLHSAVNFHNIQYVYAIENFQEPVINDLLNKAKARHK